jgi:RND family efflux transporter MFP subunit
MWKILVGIVLTILLNVGIWKWTEYRANKQLAAEIASQERPERPPAQIDDSANADPGYLGVLIAGDSVEVEPKVEGRVEEVFVKAGDEVERGTALAQLDTQSIKQELVIAQASYLEARARYARRVPLARGGISREELDSARIAVVQTRARVQQLKHSLGEARVVAPFDGTIATRYVSPGSLGGPGRPIVRLIGKGNLRVRFGVPEEDAGKVALQLPIKVALKTPSLELDGNIISVSPEVDAASRLIYAVAKLDAPESWRGKLSTGLVAHVLAAPPAPPSQKPGT